MKRFIDRKRSNEEVECEYLLTSLSQKELNATDMKQSIYIETTVVSYLVSRPSRDLIIAGHQESTRELWPKLNEELLENET